MVEYEQKVRGPWQLHSLNVLLPLRLRATCFLHKGKGPLVQVPVAACTRIGSRMAHLPNP